MEAAEFTFKDSTKVSGKETSLVRYFCLSIHKQPDAKFIRSGLKPAFSLPRRSMILFFRSYFSNWSNDISFLGSGDIPVA